MKGIQSLCEGLSIPVIVQGYGPVFYMGFPTGANREAGQQAIVDYRSSLEVDQDLYTKFVSEIVDRGVRIIPRGNWFLSSAHTDADVDVTLDAVSAVLSEVIAPAISQRVNA